MVKEDYIMVDIHPNNMKEKNYNLRGMALSNFLGTVDLATNQRVIEKQEFLGQLKQVLKLSKYKCKIIIQTFIDLNIIEEDNKYYYINPVSSNFLKLVVPTAKYCINNLSDFCFKVYCYMLNKYNMHITYRHFENYFFSYKELLSDIGYSNSTVNMNMLQQALTTLEELGFISYGHEAQGRPGKHGTYHELYSVNQIAPVQIKAAKTYLENKYEVNEDIIDDLVLPDAEVAKAWLESGAYDMQSLPKGYLEAYKEKYDEV